MPYPRWPWLTALWLTSACNPDLPSPHPVATPESSRQRMVRDQLQGPDRHITNRAVLQAMLAVPRHEFVPHHLRHQAYDDQPLPIGHHQTISQPYIVALMTQAIDPQPTDRLLEIGTGSGYQAAILAHLAAHVYSIEIIPELGHHAAQTLQHLGVTNVSVRVGDGHRGWPEAAPFDAIVVTCSPEDIPPALVQQLKDGGRLIIPVGDLASGQDLIYLRKSGNHLERQSMIPVRFVPMTGQPDPQP